ncbi:DUF4867 family protein [Paenactinomyces guangxiensis]|uniref:DUF4867 family protein n=1 Tax=Paenactinomyces guangxiensis TaxID=1490290 RepID=A0A7W1WP35_9BACL|nr:DUF4867 family protein [Paenactinomyces guangxiensis]MBA4493446.1 DUF4867 family protein [Paenactinomyces guangxiensis]MBH8590537.1 DUF4867 family protein [Paenactinomyces guangxiensis]
MTSTFERLRSVNGHFPLHHVQDDSFSAYGKTFTDWDVSELVAEMEKTMIPKQGNQYVASVLHLENLPFKDRVQAEIFGEMEVQVGYCNGRNSFLNGLEYHKSSEVNVAVTDLVLLLGHVKNIQNNNYSVERVEGFYVPKGTVLELYATTLHFAPCKVKEEGFKCVVVLPKWTNTPLSDVQKSQRLSETLLFMKNKWLLAHPDNGNLIGRGAFPGIVGENIQVYLP